MPTLSVIIPATDRPATLDRCLAAIDASSDRPDEVIVVDAPAELSAAAARNAGARSATGDVLVFVDADVEVHADAIGRIRSVLADRAEVTAVFGSYDDEPADTSPVSAFRNLLHHHVHHDGAGPAETFWTGLGAVRRERFETVGGFDEERFVHPSIEDVELGMRLAAAGDRLLLDPSIQGTHLKRWTLRSMVHTDLFRRGIPWVTLLLRERRVPAGLNLGWRHRATALLSVVTVVALLRRRWAALLGALVVVAGLNRALYALLVRRLGAVGAVAGVPLHLLHHLTAVVAVPLGLLAGYRERRTTSPHSNSAPRATGATA
ncbi:MAG: glycosyltransferase family 2 protein [Actinomycetota bacterium]